MADKTAIEKRKEKFSDKSPVEMAQEKLDLAEGMETKNFLEAMTDPSSLVKAGLSLAALAAGAPGAAAAITGLDLLKAPKEMAASKELKRQSTLDAMDDLISTKQAEGQQELQQQMAALDAFTRNPRCS